jgi:O-antigen ligase
MGLLRDVPKPAAWSPPRDEASVHDTLRYARRRDPIGHNIHTVLAAGYLSLLPLQTMPKDVAFAVLLAYALIRLPTTWRCYTALIRLPITWLLVAWAGWAALSLAWSADPRQGFDEFGAMRMLLTPVMLWPVLDRMRWLIGAALLGVLAQNIAQALQFLGWYNIRPEDGEAGRAGGWIHPIQTGTWCMAAICWNLAAVLTTRGGARIASLFLLVIACIGLILSQSRGPWLASGIVVPLTLVVIAIRRPESRRIAAVLAIVGVLAAAGAWPLAGNVVVSRIQQAWSELDEQRLDETPWSGTAVRLGLWTWAWEIFTDRPLAGAGAGSFRLACAELPSFQETIRRANELNPKRVDRIPRDHAHSTYLHTLATLGAVGGVILLATIVLLLRQCLRDPPDHPYAMATVFILFGWLIGAQFECSHLNGHVFGLFALLATITIPRRAPAEE